MPTSSIGPPPESFWLSRHSPGVMLKPKAALDDLHLAECAGADEFDGLEVGGLVVAAVGDHELHVVLLAGCDHGAALGKAGGHGLFAEHVLAGFGGSDGVLSVHGVGQGDVDGVDGVVVRESRRSFRSCRWTARDVVLGSLLLGFLAMAADESGELAGFRVSDAGHEVFHGDAAEADDAPAEAAAGGLLRVILSVEAGQSGGDGGDGEGAETKSRGGKAA